MKIGYRTIKTAIGTPLAISVAQLLGVTNFVSAGILTILCIQPSRKQSFLSAWNRFSACIIATIYSFIFFETIGYNPLVVGLMLAVFIPTTVYLNITQGIATSSVIILNLYSTSYMSVSFLVDQFLLIIIGVGIGLLLNLYMPSLDKKLTEKQMLLEENFQVVLFEIAQYIRNKNIDWDGKEITKIQELLEEAHDLVERDQENHLLRNRHPFRDYFNMRERQFELLQRMLPLVTKLPKQYSISEKIANFFEGLSNAVHPGNTAILYLEELEELRKTFDDEDLPTSREEFETRANLFRLLHEIEQYLLLKKKFKTSDVSSKRSKIKKRLE
ncbi:aromatic acid exporter family protein [Virgibacillus halodenitrificans]|uniref:aromatic acid exporter family protein n=1 Tax=Virgibacillus halodenitrificans TaxID=1482 RepID=UPI00045CB429|nr:aromatic acid exporter family protein [Virgibacillus halodenitrificans]CDQ35559.1 putative membrane protein [Virgibacillus halodenitrificans]